MATMAESTEESPNMSSSSADGNFNIDKDKGLAEATMWIDYAVEQARTAQKTVEDTLESAISITRSRLDQILSTSSAHLNQTIDSLEAVKSDYSVYEDAVFGNIKEGMLLAASHPFVTGGIIAGSGLLFLKKPRHALYYKTMRLFMSEETMFSKADAKVKALRQSIRQMEEESANLKKRALEAENEMKRGRTKLRQAGNQIQGVIRTAYKIEREAGSLKDVLKELPSGTASQFRSQVLSSVKETKRERQALNKEVTKICNYGISV